MWAFKLALFSVVFVVFSTVILIMKTKQVHYISRKTPVAKKLVVTHFYGTVLRTVTLYCLSSLTHNDGIFMCDLCIISEKRTSVKAVDNISGNTAQKTAAV